MLAPQAISVIIFVMILVQRHALGLYRFMCCRYLWSDGWVFCRAPSLPGCFEALEFVFAACGGLRPSLACQTYQPGPFVGLAAPTTSSIYKQ